MTRSTGSRVGVQHGALVFLGSMLVISACHKTAATPVVCIPRVRIVKVVQRDVPLYREWIGTLDGFVNAEVKAQVAGYIRKQVYQEGTFVRQGELLFLVDPGNHRDVRLNHQWTQVTSPIEGIAGVAQVRVSNLVNASTLLTTVSQVDPIKVQFNISEMEYVGSANGNHWAESGGSGLSPLELILQNGTVHPHRGAVIVVNHQINSQTGTIALTGSFPNPERSSGPVSTPRSAPRSSSGRAPFWCPSARSTRSRAAIRSQSSAPMGSSKSARWPQASRSELG